MYACLRKSGDKLKSCWGGKMSKRAKKNQLPLLRQILSPRQTSLQLGGCDVNKCNEKAYTGYGYDTDPESSAPLLACRTPWPWHKAYTSA